MDTSHCEAILDYFRPTPGGSRPRVVALAGPEDARSRFLAEYGQVDTVVPRPADLLDLCDALIVADRYGGNHRENAQAFLREGRAVFIDKPFACSAVDARHMSDLAIATGARLTSYSPLRWLESIDRLAAHVSNRGVREVKLVGPGSRTDPYGGLHFYGSHLADIALAVVPGDAQCIAAVERGDRTTIDLEIGRIPVRLDLVRRAEGHVVPFEASVIQDDRSRRFRIPVDTGYMHNGLQRFARMIVEGVEPLNHERMIAAVALLEDAELMLGQDGYDR